VAAQSPELRGDEARDHGHEEHDLTQRQRGAQKREERQARSASNAIIRREDERHRERERQTEGPRVLEEHRVHRCERGYASDLTKAQEPFSERRSLGHAHRDAAREDRDEDDDPASSKPEVADSPEHGPRASPKKNRRDVDPAIDGRPRERRDARDEEIEAVVIVERDAREGEVARRIDSVLDLGRDRHVAGHEVLVVKRPKKRHPRDRSARDRHGEKRDRPYAPAQGGPRGPGERDARREGDGERPAREAHHERAREEARAVDREKPRGEGKDRREGDAQGSVAREVRGPLTAGDDDERHGEPQDEEATRKRQVDQAP
jgi:hypothetical protein